MFLKKLNQRFKNLHFLFKHFKLCQANRTQIFYRVVEVIIDLKILYRESNRKVDTDL
jgi:hypothetical protein